MRKLLGCQGFTGVRAKPALGPPLRRTIHMVGKVYPSEKTSFKDAETGAEIIQYTSVGATNRTLYFTNRPYTSDGEHIVFLSDRSGQNEMYMLHLDSGKITQLTELAGQRNVSNCVHPTRPELYFHNTKRLFRVRL